MVNEAPDEEMEEVHDRVLAALGEDELPPLPPTRSPLNWYVYAQRREALVMDDELLRTSPCTCYKKDDRQVCFSEAAIGVLSEEQAARCEKKTTVEMPEEVARLLEASEACAEDKEGWVSCMAARVPDLY